MISIFHNQSHIKESMENFLSFPSNSIEDLSLYVINKKNNPLPFSYKLFSRDININDSIKIINIDNEVLDGILIKKDNDFTTISIKTGIISINNKNIKYIEKLNHSNIIMSEKTDNLFVSYFTTDIVWTPIYHIHIQSNSINVSLLGLITNLSGKDITSSVNLISKYVNTRDTVYPKTRNYIALNSPIEYKGDIPSYEDNINYSLGLIELPQYKKTVILTYYQVNVKHVIFIDLSYTTNIRNNYIFESHYDLPSGNAYVYKDEIFLSESYIKELRKNNDVYLDLGISTMVNIKNYIYERINVEKENMDTVLLNNKDVTKYNVDIINIEGNIDSSVEELLYIIVEHSTESGTIKDINLENVKLLGYRNNKIQFELLSYGLFKISFSILH